MGIVLAESPDQLAQDRHLHVERLKARALLQNTAPSLVVAVVNLLIVTALFWQHTHTPLLLGWSASLVALSAARWAIARRALDVPPDDLSSMVTLIVMLTSLSGIGWSVPLLFAGPESEPILRYLVIFMIAGMTAGAAVSFATHMSVVLAFNGPLLLLTSLQFITSGGLYNSAMAAIIILYLVSTAFLARRLRGTVEQALSDQLRAEEQAREIEALAQSLAEAVEAAEAASTAKSQFLANMSHEIRTPLNGVLGMVQLLEGTELSDIQRDYARIIGSSGRALIGVIQDVLDISRIEAGAIELTKAPFRISDAVQVSADTVEGVARRKGLTLKTRIEDEVPDRVEGDEQRVRQVLINLVGNAVKFTECGSVEISVTARDGDRVRFAVRDTGPGLTEEQCKNIFERFAQADASTERKHGGSGLGLSISSALINLMDGEIGVESQPGSGSLFWFEVPLRAARRTRPQEQQAMEISAPRPELARDAARILVVDDVATNRIVAKAMLESAGQTVLVAENGEEAIAVLESEPVDLVLMDIHMPVLAGDEAIMRIRESGKAYSRVPIIAVTADTTKGQDERLLSLGANGFASKPINFEDIRSEIARALEQANDGPAEPLDREQSTWR